MALSLRQFHSSALHERPMGALAKRHFESGRMKVVRSLLSSADGIWKYPATASRVANTLALAGTAWTVSWALINGCTGRRTLLFNWT